MAKRGKYEDIVPNLPRLGQEPSYQARVDEAKKQCQRCGLGTPTELPCIDDNGEEFEQHLVWINLNAVALSDTYIRLRRDKDKLAADEKALNLRIEAITQLLVASQDRGDEQWGKYGVKDNAMRLENGDTLRVQSEPYGQVKDKEAFRLWCIANGYERQLQLWPTTMNALVKERAKAGEPYPDGTEAFRKDIVKFVPAGKDED